ncbi:hypothetical protein A4X03_0g9589, partial [Tilletia caries]
AHDQRVLKATALHQQSEHYFGSDQFILGDSDYVWVCALQAAQARQEDTNVALNATMREVLSLLRKRGREEDEEEEEERAGKKVKKEVGNGKGKEKEVDEVDEVDKVEASEILAQLVANEIKALGGAGHERSEIEATLKSRIGHPIDLKNFLHRHPAVFSFTHGRPGLWTLDAPVR